eukprot:945383-Pelagomonas_calceolata.AAC.1
MCCAKARRACCRSLTGSRYPWEATPSNLMSVVSCGGGLWCRYHLCWAVVVPSRVSMNADMGINFFIKLVMDEATNVGVVYAALDCRDIGFCTLVGKDFLDSFSVQLFRLGQ